MLSFYNVFKHTVANETKPQLTIIEMTINNQLCGYFPKNWPHAGTDLD